MSFGVEAFILLAAVALLFYCKHANSVATRKLEEARRVGCDLQELQRSNKELREELQRCRDALQANSTFLANVGQEMRSPLSAVLGMNELLMHSELSNEQRELAKGAVESSEALLRIISDLQELARIDSGTFAPNMVPTDVSEVIREACSLCAEGARRRKLFLNIDIDHQIPDTLLIDRISLRDSLAQLLRNAILQTDRGGVVLSARKLDDSDGKMRITFSVKDTRPGISEKELETLFLPFGGEDVWTRSYSGTGLGLYICKRIVDTMGGDLKVESTAGGGTEFQFTLTLDAPGGEALATRDYAETGAIR